MKINGWQERSLFRYLLILLLYWTGCYCFSQTQVPFFENISTHDGLSHSSVNYILQDRNGFMWFATYNGLNKYDGQTFKVYQHNPKDKTSISSNGIFFIYEDKAGNIWIVNSTTGLDKFDPATETSENFSHDPNNPQSISSNEIFHVTQDSRGNIWICGDVLNRYVPVEKGGSGKFEKFRLPGSSAQISWAYEVNPDRLLLFSDYLYYFDQNKRKIFNTGVKLENSLVTSVIRNDSGDLLIGTVLHGVLKLGYDKTNGTYHRADPGKINVAPGKRSRLYKDHNHDIWIGTEGGLFRFISATGDIEQFHPNDFQKGSISDNTIYSIYEDNTKVLWIGTFSKGLDKSDFYRKPFLHFYEVPNKENSLSGNVISSISGIKPNELWVGLDVGGGIDRLLFSENSEPEIIHYKNNPGNPNSIGGNSTLCLVQRKNGEVWAGLGGGIVSRIRPEKPFSGGKPEIKNFQFDKWTFSIFEDSDGILWGGTWEAGLWRYNDHNGTFDFFLPDSSNNNSIGDKIIWSISEDHHKNLWIGGHGNGLSILTADEKRKTQPKFINFHNKENDTLTISNNTINAFCQSHDGNFWICTAGGLNRVLNFDQVTASYNNFPKLLFDSYHMADGLPSEGIVGIVEDNHGFIWTSTNFGISRMDPETGKFTNYNEAHGLQSNEFWHNAYFKNTDGMIFFGGENGFNAFYPEKITANPFLPKVVLTELLLFNKTVKVGEIINKQQVLKEPVYKAKEIVLSYKNNIITFQFAALHYAQPFLNKYAYYLDGFEDDWNYSGNQHSATYTNLDPGRYTFRVKATNNDGVWSEEVALSVVVSPPWWNTLLVKAAIILLLILIILGIFRIRLGILKHQKKNLQETVKQRTEELQEVNTLLEEKQEEILMQNEELLQHRNNLEELIQERTRELEKARLKAEESDQLKSSFLANMSHEIRTPMNAILGFSTLLKEHDFSKEEKDGFIDIINQNGETLMYLIDDILDISMIESDQLVMKPQDININKVMTDLEEFWRLKNTKGLAIEFVKDKDKELILHIDPVRFQQVLNNLLGNALKYTQKGFIRFGYEMNDHNIRFFVADSGIGIDPKYSSDIFEHFFKIESDTEKIYRGTGIGLAICKKIVEIWKGRIWVESIPATGSTFYFTIPYMSPSGMGIENLTKNGLLAPYISLENFFYVIAEDEPANYEILVHMLRLPKEKHFWGKNGKEAVDYIQRQKDYKNIMVLMDIKMPVMNGYDALQHIKKINSQIPVVAVTAYALKHEEKEIMEKGFDGYISKPIKTEKLKEIISRILTNQR